MAETTIQLFLEAEMVKGVDEVSPIKMSIDPEYLAEYQLASASELVWESASGTQPGLAVDLGDFVRSCGLNSVGNASGIGRKHCWVINLSRNPPLHQHHILMRRKLDGLLALVEPSIRVISVFR